MLTGFKLLYSITAEPCMESVTCYGMESMQSIVWNQAAGKYTFGDAIRPRQFHTRWRVMPYQACGLNATKNKKAVRWTTFVFGCGEGTKNLLTSGFFSHKRIAFACPVAVPASCCPRFTRLHFATAATHSPSCIRHRRRSARSPTELRSSVS